MKSSCTLGVMNNREFIVVFGSGRVCHNNYYTILYSVMFTLEFHKNNYESLLNLSMSHAHTHINIEI